MESDLDLEAPRRPPPEQVGSVSEMERVVEQLQVAEEELRVQNDELHDHRAATEAALARYQELFDLAPDPYVTTDRYGAIREANVAAARLLNCPTSELAKRQLISFVSTGMRRAFRVGMNRVAAGAEPFPGSEEWTVRLKPRRKEELEVSVTAAGVHREGEEVTSIRWLLRDVTQRRRVESELRNLNVELERRVVERTAALEAANWAKAEFLSVMAHELRTPLNAIIGYSELLEMGISGPVSGEQLSHLARIRLSAQRLVGLVNEVLDLGKVEAGQLKVERGEHVIGEAIDAALALVLPQSAARGIHLYNDCRDGSELRYIGDASRVEQILINLLSNATKFTDAGGEVRIECSIEFRAESDIVKRNAWLALRVRDTGIGMTQKSLDSVFNPFVQVEEPLTRTRGGTGLGLTIGRRLARLMGGDITVASQLGKGSTFTLWLPAAADILEETPEELERRSPARYAQGIARLGTALLEQIETIVREYAKKLKSRSGIRKARDLTRSELEDHAAAFLADIVQALVAIEDAQGGPSEIMRDGSVLRRIISERHGAQRQRLGWTETELRAEFRMLRRSVDDAVKRVSVDEAIQRDESSQRAARSVLNQLLDTAEEISVRGFRLAGMDELQNSQQSR